MKINIVAGAIKDPHFFIDLVTPLYNCLCEMGHDCTMLPMAKDVNSSITDLCIGIFLHIDRLPKNYIIWNLEPLSPGSPHLTMRLVNKIRKARVLLHYNPNEIEYVKQFNNNVIYFPYSYHRSLENMYNLKLPIKEDIDVLFYGTPNEYRLKTIDNIRKSGINIVAPGLVFTHKRDEYIYRSKIILLVNYFDNNPDIVRTTYLLSQKKCIVVDSFGNNSLSNIYKSFPIVENSMLIETIQDLLLNEDKRNKVINDSYEELLKQPDMKSYVMKLCVK
tara:strand:+ start:180 stop:1007 length:828 start_codon:yes stop_codon:yes gene_type:complete